MAPKSSRTAWNTSPERGAGGGTTVRTFDVAPSAPSAAAYNRVVLVFRQANNPPNYAAIKSFNLEAADVTHAALGTPIPAVPEPSSAVLLLAGLGPVAWLMGRRRRAA